MQKIMLSTGRLVHWAKLPKGKRHVLEVRHAMHGPDGKHLGPVTDAERVEVSEAINEVLHGKRPKG